jgi:aminoglycoside 3-N-acetyltransferase
MTLASWLGPREVQAALAGMGLGRGDIVMLHADALAAAQFPPMPQEARLDLLLESIQEVLGAEGTLVLPTFTYSFTQGQEYDPATSPSQVGMLGEHFRRLPGVSRSGDPLFSVAAKGARARELTQADASDCFGPDSVFARLHRLGGKILCLGCTLQVVTFLHYVERRLGVDYRYDKQFTGLVKDSQGRRQPHAVTYFVRDLERDSESVLLPLQQRLEAAGLLARGCLGRVGMVCVHTNDFYEQTRALLAESPLALIKEGAGASQRGDANCGGGL